MAKKADNSKPSQLERFKQAARELGADDSEERFREVLRKVASAPYVKHAAKGKKAKPRR